MNDISRHMAETEYRNIVTASEDRILQGEKQV